MKRPSLNHSFDLWHLRHYGVVTPLALFLSIPKDDEICKKKFLSSRLESDLNVFQPNQKSSR